MLNRRDMTDRIVFRHVVGVVGSEQDVVETEYLHQRRQLTGRKHHSVDIDALEVSRRRLRQCAMAIRARAPGMVDAARISTEISGAMHCKNFKPRMAFENAIEDQ